ncbi:MAG: DUF2267 domain-containing protein [Balneolaceae bacterium]|nr:DUF2267 domain-containing protein [Balneolaceae bacterium]
MDRLKKDLHWFEKLQTGPDAEKQETSRTDIEDMEITTVNLQKFIAEAGRWIDEVSHHLETPDRKDRAWSALRSVMHTLRDRIPPEESFQLSAQLPMLIRGLYFESYKYSAVSEKFNADELLKRIEDGMSPGTDVSAEDAFRAVLQVLYDHVSEGEMSDIYATMPKSIRRLWDKNR